MLQICKDRYGQYECLVRCIWGYNKVPSYVDLLTRGSEDRLVIGYALASREGREPEGENASGSMKDRVNGNSRGTYTHYSRVPRRMAMFGIDRYPQYERVGT